MTSVGCVKLIEGEWKDSSAGGSIEYPTCRFNPQYLIRCKGSVPLTITLESTTSVKIGFFVVKGETVPGYPVLAFGKDVIFKTDFQHNKVEGSVPVDNTNQFALIPCTLTPNEEAKFMIKISCQSTNEPNFVTVDRPQHSWKHSSFNGEWKSENAGGCANYSQTFLKNPQLKLTLPQKSLVTFLITQKPAEPQDTIGFYVALAPPGGGAVKELTRKELIFKSSFSSRKEAIKSQELEAGTYVIIPCTFDPGYVNSFTFIAFADVDITISQIEVVETKATPVVGPTYHPIDENIDKIIEEYPTVVSAKGAWALKNDTAGGCMNYSSWRKNPQFFLQVRQSGEFLIVLQQEDRKNKKLLNTIGFYIATGDGRRKITMLARDMVGKSNFKRANEVACKVNLEVTSKPYVVIPCTFKPDINMDFEIFVRSKTPNAATIEPCSHVWHSITLQDEWKGKTAGGCKNNVSWVHNPQYFLQVHKPCSILLVQKQESSKPVSHGFYVFKSSANSPHLFYQEETKVITKSVFIDDEEVWKELDLSATIKDDLGGVDEDASKDDFKRIRAQTQISSLPATASFETHYYTILSCTFEPKLERGFSLTLHYDGDPSNASLTPVTPIMYKEVRVAGSWETHSSGGCINFPITFKNNPHYYFRSSHAVKSTIVLSQAVSPNQPVHTIGFYLTTAGETGRRLLRVSKQQLIAKSPFINKSHVWIDFDMEANEKYILIPCTFSPRVLCQYTLSVYIPPSSIILPSLYAPPDDWIYNSFEGEWKGETAAGSKDFSERWRDNPSYSLTVKDTTILNIFLSQQNDIPLPIGFYLLKGVVKDKKKDSKDKEKKDKSKDKVKLKQKIIDQSDFVRATEVAREGLKLKKGSYTLVLSCLLANQEGYYVLTTFSDKDIFLESLEEKAGGSEDKRHNVAQEMLTTEQTYVNNLEIVTRCFMEPLRTFAATDEGKMRGISPQTVKILFSNIGVLLKYNQTLLADLQARLATWGKMSKLGDIFLKMASFLMIYAEYCNGYPSAIAAYRDLKKNEDMTKFFNQCQVSTNQKLSLNDYLIMPVQRIPRYVMLLKELLKHTPNDHPDYADLTSARFKIEHVTQALDAKKQQAESLAKLMAISDSITKKGTVRVAEAHRRYIREGKLTVERDGRKGQYYVFLFNDSIFLTSMKKIGKYVYVDKVDFAEGMETVLTGVDVSLPDFGFLLVRKKSAKESKVRGFYATSEEERTSWAVDVQSQIVDLDSVRSVALST